VSLHPRELWAKCYSRTVSAERVKHPEPDGSADIGADDATIDQAALLAAITEERDRLATEKAELHDRNLRTQAEFQNLRRRVEKERVEFHEYAAEGTVQTLLPILDDFERALKTHTADTVYARGMELIYQHLADALKKLGLETITTKGQKFDPHVHHAVDMVETGDVEEQTILDEYQPGYNFRGRLLRPAMVKVAVTKK
jgi:molecular chaperone GrpE